MNEDDERESDDRSSGRAKGRREIWAIARHELAEHSILGLVMVRPDVLGWLSLTPEHFFDPKLRQLWTVFVELGKANVPIDVVTVEDRLRRHGCWEAIGGHSFVAKLMTDLPMTSDVSSGDHWSEILHRKLVTRRALMICSGVEEMVRRGVEGGDLLDEVLGDLGRVDRYGPLASQDITLADAVSEEMVRIEAGWQASRQAGGQQMAGLPIGIRAVDEQTGGIPIGVLSVLAARPGVGKSSLMFQALSNIARTTGGGAMLFTNEDRSTTLARVALANQSGVNRAKLRNYGELNEIDLVDLRGAAAQLSDLGGRLYVVHAHGMNGQQIARIIRAERRRKDLRAIGFDYIQNAPVPMGMKKHEAIEQNLGAIEQAIAEEGLGALIASQLRRPDPKDENRRPSINGMKDAGAIEQKAKLILALHETPALAQRDRIEILVLKQNEGAKMMVIEVDFHRAQTRFER